jgi:signal transduction histidine kinase
VVRSSGGKLNINQLILYLRWPILGAIGLLILVLEVVEHPGALQQLDQVFISEILFLEGLLVMVGVAIGWLLKTIREKTSTVNILKTKNDLSQQLTTAQDWDQMTSLLVEFPRSILPLSASSLLTYSPKSEQFELTAIWSSDQSDPGFASQLPASIRCTQCVFTRPFILRPIESLCTTGETDSDLQNDYCLPLSYGDSLRALLQLRLPPDYKPDTDQVELLNNLGPEMAIALRAAQENHTREQLAVEQAAEAVRQDITRDMHDMLAQNLAYMQLKLDQISQLEQPQEADDFHSELSKLRDVADESYELVRSTLGALHPNNSRRLADILSQHAYAVAERGNFEVKFTQEGQSQPLDPLVIHHIYQLYREALSNIEKHAQANLVKTFLVWMDESFSLTIEDNGSGFDPQARTDRDHYGLSFMRERVDELHGQFSISSNPGTGTTIVIAVPTVQTNKLSALTSK